jgi:hypothetical protein
MPHCKCKTGFLVETKTDRALEILCSKCGAGYHIPLTPISISPCMDPRFRGAPGPDLPRPSRLQEEDRDEKPEDLEEETEEEAKEEIVSNKRHTKDIYY